MLTVLTGCTSFSHDYTSEDWRYDSLRNPNLRAEKEEALTNAQAINKDYAQDQFDTAENDLTTKGRQTQSASASNIPQPPSDASEAELDDYAERLRKLLGDG